MTENNAQLSAENPEIGYVIGGGLEANLQVRLNVPAQQVQEGAFVVMDSGTWRFYGLVTDLQLGATDERFANELNSRRFAPALAAHLDGQTLFTNLAVMPSLMLDRGPEPGAPGYTRWIQAHQDKLAPLPVKTVPAHHSTVRLADRADIAQIFGEEDNKKVFRIGETREQGHAVCLDLDRFVQRSAGIFGTTGSGKSFLARMILAGLIHADHASTLIFDMHNEYGPDTTASDTGKPAFGLKGKFGSKVRLVGLGSKTQFGQLKADFSLEISHQDITPEDVLLLTETLNLRETSATTLDALQSSFGTSWFTRFMAMKVGATEIGEDGKKTPTPDSVAFWARANGVNEMAAEGLHSKLVRVNKLPYLVKAPASNGLDEIISNLENGKHVVLSFGSYDDELDYLLVTNLITRKIRDAWVEKTNDFHRENRNKEPRPLVVVVEEAHKLLSRDMASQTIFSTIAREMRKYYVTLLIIDQRPSQIYDEVMSQLGTRICGLLGDEDDINAVLAGLAGKQALRGMLSKLQAKEEALMLGWGVPMPIPIRSRRYDTQFWMDLLGKENEPDSMQGAIAKMGYEDDPD